VLGHAKLDRNMTFYSVGIRSRITQFPLLRSCNYEAFLKDRRRHFRMLLSRDESGPYVTVILQKGKANLNECTIPNTAIT